MQRFHISLEGLLDLNNCFSCLSIALRIGCRVYDSVEKAASSRL